MPLPAVLSAPSVVGAGISALGSLVGGLFGSSSASKEAALNRKMQKDFAQKGIRWRVEDAKAAGLHPLYALGAQVPSASPIYTQDPLPQALADMGQSIGGAVAAQATPHEKMMAGYALRQAEQSLQEGDARILALRSEAFRNMMEGNARQGMPSLGDPLDPNVVPSGLESQAPNQGMVKVDPATVIASHPNEPGRTAGINPGMTRYNIGGVLVDLPSAQGGLAESLESLESPLTMYPVLLVNMARLGRHAGGALADAVQGVKGWSREKKREVLRLLDQAEQQAAALRGFRR